MRFDTFLPADVLKPYIKHFAISENSQANTYKIFPSTGLVMGFQYKGKLFSVVNGSEQGLSSSGITGISDSIKTFQNTSNTGTVLVYFTETGLAAFTYSPVNELFNLSLSAAEIFDGQSISETEEKLSGVLTDRERIAVLEKFFLSQLKAAQTDKLVVEAVRLIYKSQGTMRIKELGSLLAVSQSPLEKRFRKIVGTTPKKFASIVRFNTVLDEIESGKTLADICFDNGFFDQAHLAHDFKRFTGNSPEQFKR